METIILILVGLVALVAALVVLSFPILFIIYVIRRIQTRQMPPQQRAASSPLTMHFLVAVIVLIMSAIAIPNLKFSAKAKQSEAKANLGAIYQAQLAYFSRTHTYTAGEGAFRILNWEPAGQNRYAYYCQGAMIPNKLLMRIDYVPKPDGRWPITAKPQSSQSGFTCMAIGNMDNDDTLDVWSINDSKILRNDLNDI
jgi:type IV pilus assembly protein PilA